MHLSRNCPFSNKTNLHLELPGSFRTRSFEQSLLEWHFCRPQGSLKIILLLSKNGHKEGHGTPLKTLTSLDKKVGPFCLSDNSIWSFPSLSSLAITALGGYFSLGDHSIWSIWVHCPPILVSPRKNGQEESRLLNSRRLGSSRSEMLNSMNLYAFLL